MNVKGTLIVDACVAQGVGHANANIDVVEAKRVLDALKDGPAGILMTPLLMQEWKNHASRFMIRWLAQMQSRKRIIRRPDRRVQDFRTALTGTLAVEHGRVAVEKDAHLVEAAILYRAGVLSTDEQQRRLLQKVASGYPRAGLVQWFNPGTQAALVLAWIAGECVDSTAALITPGVNDDMCRLT
jgi:hypothetical protein